MSTRARVTFIAVARRGPELTEGTRRINADGRTQVLTRADAGWLKWETVRAPRGLGRPKPRKCPAEPASDFRAGTRRPGADGAVWVATVTRSKKKRSRRGTRWVREAAT
jgi:hypothetical protein